MNTEEVTEEVTESEDVQPQEEEVEPETPEEEVQEPEDIPEEEVVEEVEQPKSRREALRIAKLVQRQVERQQPQVQGIDYSQALDADDATRQALEQDRQQYGQANYNQGLQQAQSIQFHTRLEMDAPKMEAKYPQLDANDSANFNPALADAINQWYLSTAGYDPKTDTVQNSKVRYSDFVEGIMEMADEIAGEKVAKSSKNIAKQVANTGLRPDGSSAKRLNLNQAPENMNDEELDAVIAQSIKKR